MTAFYTSKLVIVHGVLRYFEINSSKLLLTAASAPDYHTKQFTISKATLTSQGEYTWNVTKVKKW